ncbi:MAG: PRC-barrel domain-containing protein [Rhodospirillales bacterium]
MGLVVDVLFDAEARPRAAVIDFGGFLGVGSRRIAIDWQALHIRPTDHASPVLLDLARADVQAAPNTGHRPSQRRLCSRRRRPHRPQVQQSPSSDHRHPSAGRSHRHPSTVRRRHPCRFAEAASREVEDPPAVEAAGTGAPHTAAPATPAPASRATEGTGAGLPGARARTGAGSGAASNHGIPPAEDQAPLATQPPAAGEARLPGGPPPPSAPDAPASPDAGR